MRAEKQVRRGSRTRRHLLTLGLATLIVALLVHFGPIPPQFSIPFQVKRQEPENSNPKLQTSSLGASTLQSGTDIALANLQCARGLPQSDEIQFTAQLVTLDDWARRVKSETERHLYKYRANPAEFDHSEGYFRMVMMAVVLYEDFGVRYNPALIAKPSNSGADYSFFADSRDIFLHGLIGTNRTGTCSSLPVLYVAIGRRLGYPLNLVTTKAHLFLRWEGQGERFNLEATGRGMNRYDDAHYKQWPFPVSEEEMAADGYLKSLAPEEEMAMFQSMRGHCLIAAARHAEAAQCYARAAQLAPNARGYRLLHDNALRLSQFTNKDLR